MQVKVINISKNNLPRYETKLSAGMDVRADFSRVTMENPIKMRGGGKIVMHKGGKSLVQLDPGSRALIPTGLRVDIPEGYEIQVRPRSGLALKAGLTVLNTPGTIDADYRGEIGIIIINLGMDAVCIEDGERIAQIVLNKVEQIEWFEVEELTATERGEGGFNSTGVR